MPQHVPPIKPVGQTATHGDPSSPRFTVTAATRASLVCGYDKTTKNALAVVDVCKCPRRCSMLRSITPSNKQKGLLGSTSCHPAHAPVHQPGRLRKVQAGREQACACDNLHPACSVSAHVQWALLSSGIKQLPALWNAQAVQAAKLNFSHG